MASIDYIRSVARNILDKDGNGWIGDNKFNNIITNVQDEVFNDIYALYTQARGKRLRRLEYKGFVYSGVRQIEDDLRPLYRTGVSLTQISNNTFSLPSDYRYIEGLTYDSKDVDILRQNDTLNYLLTSRSAPTTRYPAATVENGQVTMYPTSIVSGVTMSYYKNPRGIDANGNPVDQSPTWAYNTVSNQSVYNASNSIQLELPESTYNKIIVRLVSRYGVNIRDYEVVQYAENEEAKNQNNL